MKPYGPSRLKGYIEAPKGVDVQKFLTLRESAMREIADFTALIRFDGGVGSGTFINSGSVNGILTAYHVAKEIIKGGFLQLIIAQYAHKLPVSLEFFQHQVIGDST